jgi:hypothetical protein
MRYVLIALLLTGCASTTVPVTVKFPQAPATLLEKCITLKKLEEPATLSSIAKTVAENYTSYHECSLKNDTWIDWYGKQKTIFGEIK